VSIVLGIKTSCFFGHQAILSDQNLMFEEEIVSTRECYDPRSESDRSFFLQKSGFQWNRILGPSRYLDLKPEMFNLSSHKMKFLVRLLFLFYILRNLQGHGKILHVCCMVWHKAAPERYLKT
jgi:hypothetical protein